MAGHSGLGLTDVFAKVSDEAFVEYFLFPEKSILTDADKCNDLLMRLNVEALSLMEDYLWQKDSFNLKLDESSDCFHGILQFDANVEDEWFTVYILQKLTQKFSGLIARVIDQDGEFLLIEAADYLPEWAESDELCQQRVYISNGSVHLVGKIQVGDGKVDPVSVEPGPLDVFHALELIRKYPAQTKASSTLQEVIRKRIGDPAQIPAQRHHANLFLPPKVAMILLSRPASVSAAVRAFHYKDSVDMKTARLMTHFSPIESLVKHRVRFTRPLYAMLSSQEFYPDMKLKWKFPMKNSPDYKGHSLGAKLSLGLEILLSRARPNGSTNVTTSAAWLKYAEKLKMYNYYQGLYEGSRDYKVLEERAKFFFQASVAPEIDSDVDDLASQQIQTLLNQYKQPETLPSIGELLLPDDDDSWMDVNADELETLLEAQFKSKISDQKLDQIPEKLKEFMTQMSDFSGVEVQTDGSEHDDGSGDEDGDGGLDPLDFRADEFVSAMDKLLLELGKPSNELDLSEPSSEEEDGDTDALKEIKKKINFPKDSKIHKLMGQMDDELKLTEVGKTFQTMPGTPMTSSNKPSSSTSVPTYEPVDIDMNALANILESFQSQEDSCGPSANLLRNVGFDITKATKKKQ